MRTVLAMLRNIRELYKNTRGVEAVEYGLITALIAVAMIPALSILGVKLSDVFTVVANHL